jgi:hypothetical protein
VPVPGLSRAQYTELTGDSGAAVVPVLTSVLTTVNTPADSAACSNPWGDVFSDVLGLACCVLSSSGW